MTSTAEIRGRARAGVALAPVALASVLALSGCSSGGDTTCSKFRTKSFAGQKKIIEKLLEEKGQSTSPINVATATLSAKGYCFTHGGSEKVKNIYGPG